MLKLFITIIGPERSIDLEVPGQLQPVELIPALLEISGLDLAHATSTASLWSLNLAETRTPLSPTHSLQDSGVADGATLLLQKKHLAEGQEEIAPQISGESSGTVPEKMHRSFHRSPRNYPEPLPKIEFQIQLPPPIPQKPGGAAALLQFIYPLFGFLTLLVTLVAVSNSGGKPNALMIGLEATILPVSLGMMFFSTFIQRRISRAAYNTEKKAYRAYLENIQKRLNKIAGIQLLYNERLYPDPTHLPALVSQQQMLWERRPTDDDFLTTRVGLVQTRLCSPISFQEDFKTKYEQDLLQEARNLVTRYRYIDDQPVTIPLSQHGTVSITGPHTETTSLMRAMLGEVITFHAPDEVRIIGYFSEQTIAEWSWLKWTPHVRCLHPIRTLQTGRPALYSMLATSTEDLQMILETQVGPELEQRRKFSDAKKLKEPGQTPVQMYLPHLLVVLEGYIRGKSLANIPVLANMMSDGYRLGITVLCICHAAEQGPLSSTARLALTPLISGHRLSYQEIWPGGRKFEFIQPDNLDVQRCEEMARDLISLQLIDPKAKIDFSRNIDLLELYPSLTIETSDIQQLWKRAGEKQLLRVPIGIQKDEPLLLDLNEAALGGYGPHGLVIGATGSGKSELLRTVITSLALTHDPFMLNFVLVDIFAGTFFADAGDLPHMAGMITNLDGDSQTLNRVYTSLLGEQQRRQNMLSRAGNLSNIRQYQAMWRRNPSMEPMPYLLIIVDEFAQLTAISEDFLELFIQFGRVGRSLGIHMMLATQRIEEGRMRRLQGLLSYRIGLRTFSLAESISAIGRPDAYYLPPMPGAGYFKVDEDIFTSFKTALVSAPYDPPEKLLNPMDWICEFNSTGSLVPYTLPAQAPVEDENKKCTTMHMIVEQIAQVTPPDGGWRVHTIWQPSLGEQISLNEVLKKCDAGLLAGFGRQQLGYLCVPVGMLDRPADQTQVPMILDFSGVGSHLAIVGAPQSGKSTFLCTLLASLIGTHTPREVQIYGFDFGGGLLRVFKNAPHVGAICNRTDRDRIRQVLRRLKQVPGERETLFAAQEINDMATYRQMRQQNKLDEQEFGDIFLIVDNFGQLQAGFAANNEDSITDINYLITNGLTYGVHVILATNLWSEIRPSLRAHLAHLELRLNDPGDSEIDRKLAALLWAGQPGRGLHPSGLIFQTARPMPEGEKAGSSLSMQHALEKLIERSSTSWTGPVAPPIHALPLEIQWSELPIPDNSEPGDIFIGLEERQLRPQHIHLTAIHPHFLILGEVGCGKTNLLRVWMQGLEKYYSAEQIQFAIIDYRRSLLDLAQSTHIFSYLYTPLALKEGLERLKAEIQRRINIFPTKQANDNHWQKPHFFLFIDDYETLLEAKENPLKDFFEYILRTPDSGFHFVLACHIEETTIHLDPILKSLRNQGTPTLLMSENVRNEQLSDRQRFAPLPPGRGYLFQNNTTATLIQVAHAEVFSFFREAEDPYVVGRPVRGNSFVGRRDIMKMIQDNLKPSAGKNVLVLRGQRRTGKTSVLLRVYETLAEESQGIYLPVFVDLEGMSGIENEGQFFYLLAEQIREDLALHDISLPSIGDFEKAPTITFKLQFLKPVTETLGSRQVLLILDEFQILQEFIDKGRVSSEILHFCRHLMQHTPLLFLIAGTHKLRELTSEYWSVFFNLAIFIDIGVLSASETEWLITEPVRRWYTLEQSAVHEIVRIAGCHPYFTQLVCKKLLEVRNEAKISKLASRDVEEAINRALHSGYEQIGYPWTEGDCSNSERLILSILALNDAPIPRDTIQQQLSGSRLDIAVSRALARLQERGIVKWDNEGKVGFVVPLLQNWIRRERYDDLARAMQYNEEHQVQRL